MCENLQSLLLQNKGLGAEKNAEMNVDDNIKIFAGSETFVKGVIV